jgi:hypothetical protein
MEKHFFAFVRDRCDHCYVGECYQTEGEKKHCYEEAQEYKDNDYTEILDNI